MRRFVLSLLTLLLAVPAWAGENSNRRWASLSECEKLGIIPVWKDADGCSVLKRREDYRHTKLTASFSTDWSRTTSDLNAAGYSFNEGTWFLGALVRGWNDYVHSRRGAGPSILSIGGSSTAHAVVYARNPEAFTIGDTFRLYGGRSATLSTGDVNWSAEIRPRLGARSRWRIGFGLGYSRITTLTTDSYADDVRVDSVRITPYSREFTRVDLDLSRNLTTETFTLDRSIVLVTAGPEFDIVRTGWLDLSLEGGAAVWVETKETNRDLRPGTYAAFAPELTAPDADPHQLVTFGETVNDGGFHEQGAAQFYAGARLEVYPLRRLGVGANVRWFAKDRPWDRTYADPFLGPVDAHTEARHWTASVSVVLALGSGR